MSPPVLEPVDRALLAGEFGAASGRVRHAFNYHCTPVRSTLVVASDPKAALRPVGLLRHNAYKGMGMTTNDIADWDAIIADPRFQRLHRRKTIFLGSLMAVSVAYYFLLPIGAAYFQDVLKTRVWGVINVGLVFALSEFVVAWAIALFYSRRAGREFDHLAAQIAADYAVRKRA